MYYNFNANHSSDYELSEIYKTIIDRKYIEYDYCPNTNIYNFKKSYKYNNNFKNIGEHFKWNDNTLHFFNPMRFDFSDNFELLEFIKDELSGLYKYIIDNNEYSCVIGISRKIQYNYVENFNNVELYKYYFENDQNIINVTILLCMIRKLIFLGNLNEYENIFVLPGKYLEKYVKICKNGLYNILNFSKESAINPHHSYRIGINNMFPKEQINVLKELKEIQYVMKVNTLIHNV